MYKEQGITFQPKTNKNFNNKIKNDIIERNNEFIKEKLEILKIMLKIMRGNQLLKKMKMSY